MDMLAQGLGVVCRTLLLLFLANPALAASAKCPSRHFTAPPDSKAEALRAQLAKRVVELARDPVNVAVLLDAGWAHFRLGELAQARRFTQLASEIAKPGEERGKALYNLGRILDREGHTANARTHYLRSLAHRYHEVVEACWIESGGRAKKWANGYEDVIGPFRDLDEACRHAKTTLRTTATATHRVGSWERGACGTRVEYRPSNEWLGGWLKVTTDAGRDPSSKFGVTTCEEEEAYFLLIRYKGRIYLRYVFHLDGLACHGWRPQLDIDAPMVASAGRRKWATFTYTKMRFQLIQPHGSESWTRLIVCSSPASGDRPRCTVPALIHRQPPDEIQDWQIRWTLRNLRLWFETEGDVDEGHPFSQPAGALDLAQ